MEQEISDLDLLSEINTLAEKLGRAPTKAVMYSQGQYSPSTYVERFGSWRDALEEADVDATEENRHNEAELMFGTDTIEMVEELLDRTDEDDFLKGRLLAELMRLAIDLRDTPTEKEMNKFGKYTPTLYENGFGSWNNAIYELGLEPNQHREVSNKELIIEVNRLSEQLDEPPSAAEIQKYSIFSLPTYYNRFDSWEEVLQRAGLESQ